MASVLLVTPTIFISIREHNTSVTNVKTTTVLLTHCNNDIVIMQLLKSCIFFYNIILNRYIHLMRITVKHVCSDVLGV